MRNDAMVTPKHEIDQLLEESKVIDAEEHPSLARSLAFGVAQCIVQYNDPGLLEKLPDWIGQQVHEMSDSYMKMGQYRVYSNVGTGMVDHSETMRWLTELLAKTHK
jgi:hypothetical protein